MHDRPQPLPRSASFVALGLLAALVAGCGGEFGDPPIKRDPNEYGQGTRISSMLGGFYGPAPWVNPMNQSSQNCAYPPSANVFTTGATVTAVDTFDETGDGAVGSVYIQDTVADLPDYAGISLFSPSYTPPDLRIAPGDVVDVRGTFEEFAGPSTSPFSNCQTLPQISGTVAFRFDGVEPTPREIDASELGNYDSARKYLGMLVKVKNVVVSADGVKKSGRYNAPIVASPNPPSISDELSDVGTDHPLKANDSFKSVTGIVTYFYSFHIAPRSAADFEP